MNATLLNQEEKQNMNTILAQSQEQRMQFEMDMAIILTIDESSNLEQLYEMRISKYGNYILNTMSIFLK